MSRRRFHESFLSRGGLVLVVGFAVQTILGGPIPAAADLLDWRVLSTPSPAFNELFGAEMKKIVVDRLTDAGFMQNDAEFLASVSQAARPEAAAHLTEAKAALAEKTAVTPVALHTTLPWAYWLAQAVQGDGEINAMMTPERDPHSGLAVFLAMPEPIQTQIDLPYGDGKILVSILGTAPKSSPLESSSPEPEKPPTKAAKKPADKASADKASADKAPAEQVQTAAPTVQERRFGVALVLDADGIVTNVVRFTAPYADEGPSVTSFAAVDGRVLLYQVKARLGKKTTTTAIQIALPATP